MRGPSTWHGPPYLLVEELLWHLNVHEEAPQVGPLLERFHLRQRPGEHAILLLRLSRPQRVAEGAPILLERVRYRI